MRHSGYAGKNLRHGKIAEAEVERFTNLDKKEAFVQCWNLMCLSVMHLRLGASRPLCRYCGGGVEVLTIDGKPVSGPKLAICK